MLSKVMTRLSQLGYTVQESETPALSFLIDKVINDICNFCAIPEIPEELEEAAIDQIAGEYLAQLYGLGKLGDDFSFSQALASITEGDSSFNFKDGDSDETRFKSVLEMLTGMYPEKLLPFRRLRW